MTHEYLTPVRCILNIALLLLKSLKNPQDLNNVMMILRTSKLLLAQINTNLDGSLLSQDHFIPAYSVQSIKTVVEETVDLLRS